jgi:hypothetical protein
MAHEDFLFPIEIGYGAGDLEDAMVSTCRKSECIDGAPEYFFPPRCRHGSIFLCFGAPDEHWHEYKYGQRWDRKPVQGSAESGTACRCTHDGDRSGTRRDIPALPYCKIELKIARPLFLPDYSNTLNTLGDHIRKKRLNLGLFKKDVANIIGTNDSTIWN